MEISSVLESNPHPYLLCDSEGRIKQANTKWKEFTGNGTKASCSWFSLIHPREVDKTKKMWKQHVAGEVPFEVTHRLSNAHGEFRYALSIINNIIICHFRLVFCLTYILFYLPGCTVATPVSTIRETRGSTW